MASGHASSSHVHEKRKYEALVVAAGLACLVVVLFSRSPNLLLRARFFAEDGQLFYQQAHELGIAHSLLRPNAGYLHLFPRLVAGLSLFVPLFYVPLFFNVVALTVQGITAVYLCSGRMRNIGPLPLRTAAAFLYLGLPHIGEVWGRLTNSQWHLAVLSFLILIAAPAQSRLGTWFDRIVLAVGALTGPFSVLLLPIAIIAAVYRRGARTITNLVILGAGAAVQAVTMLINGRPETGKLGASFPLLLNLLVRWLFVTVLPNPWHPPQIFTDIGYVVFVAGVAALAWILWKGSFEVRCALLFGAIVIAASLASPLVATAGDQWPVMLNMGAGERYWFIPRVVAAVAGLWVVAQPFSKWARAAGILVMAVLLLFCLKGWPIAQWPGIHFRTYVHVFNQLPIGATLRVPVEPTPSWTMVITKKPLDWTYHEDGAFTDGEIEPVHDWLSRQPAAAGNEDSDPAPGGVILVNGGVLDGTGTAVAPVHVSLRTGALLEGWAVSSESAPLKPMDEMYAVVSDRVVKGDQLPYTGLYRNIQVEHAMYMVFLPSTVLHTGPQEITIMGRSRSDNKLRICGQRLYIYGDS
jgi:hypothetical protein